jgi:hypothetical protein
MRSSTAIQADLNAAYSIRLKAMDAQSYMHDSGQGKQSVTRANLSEINKTINLLESELETALAEESGSSGIEFPKFERD